MAQASLPIVVKNHGDTHRLRYDQAVYAERSYYLPLDYILQDSLKVSEERLVQFVQEAVGHLQQELIGTVGYASAAT